MAKVVKGRVVFNGATEQANGSEIVSGRQLLAIHDGPVPNAPTGGILQVPQAASFGIAKAQVAVGPVVATDFAASTEAGLGSTLRTGHYELILTARHVVNDPRTESLGYCGGCGTCAHNDGKGFDGYERRGADPGAQTDTLPWEPMTEGVQTVAVGGTVSGAFQVTGDEDQIQVALVAGETYSFHLYGAGPNAVTDTFLQLYAPDGTTLIAEDDDGSTGIYSLITFTATTTGTYNLVASSFDNPGDPGLGDWTLAVRQQGADEAPSAPPSAVPVTVGYNYGFISPAGTDEDVYSINLTAGFIYNFEVGAGADYNTDYLAVPTGEVDTIIRIYDSAGTLLFSNDDIDFPDDISSAIGFIPETSGTYYVEIDGYSGQSGGYVLEITETDLSTLDPLDAIDWGGPANAVDNTDTLLIYFAADGETYDGVESMGWTAYEQQQALAAFQTYSEFADLTFAITTNAAEADFHLVTTESDEFLGYFNPPGETNAGVGVFAINGTGWDRDGTAGSMEQGGYGWITLIHEFGHGLGMAHPHDNGGGSDVIPGVTGPFGSYGIFDLNQGVYTTMSYNDGWQLHPDVDGNGFPVPDTLDYAYQGTPMALDIALMQIKYGPVTANTGNNVYQLLDANVAGTFYQTIWDTGGTDEIAYVGTASATIDLTSATLDYSPTGAGVLSWVDGIFGGFTIAAGVVIENATGGEGDDILVGNSANNILTGNEGNDTFIGRAGDDEIYGGDGADTVILSGNQADYTITAIVGGYTIEDNNTADGDDGFDTVYDITYAEFADGTVNLDDAPGNQAPTITGLESAVVFNEQAVNGAPQLIDADVTFSDSDGNFDGGTLTVTGLLAEDVVAIRNQGNLAGQVGVSGANVSYGGTVIGTFTGGNGTGLTVTFNNLATTLAVEAVIENLTYANASNDPTENRTLTINVTDDEGASLIGTVYTPGPYTELTGANDPFENPTILPTFGAGPVLAFVDVNNDGDLDVIVGDQPGTLRYFDNNAGTYTEVTGASNPFDGVIPGPGTYSSPEAIDIDGDNDLDLVVGGAGSLGGQFVVYRNNDNGTWTNLVGAGVNPLDGFDIGNFSDPAGGDFDGDGDIDVIASNAAGNIFVFQNNGSGVFTQLAGAANPFNGVDIGNYASVTAADIDGDGDLDVVAGQSTGTLITFINNGSGVFTNTAPTGIFATDFGSYSLPTLADIDGDGDADLVVADGGGGDSRVFLNTGGFTVTPAPTIQVTVNSQNDAPAGTSGAEIILENTTYTFTAADFGFSDALEGDDFLGVLIATVPGNGALTLNGIAVTAGQFVNIADINGGLLEFAPDPDENGPNYASFTFQVRDDGGTANGGQDTDQSPNTFSFAVTPDNFAPELTDVDSPVTFLENVVNATPQFLDPDVTLTDAKGFANGSVVVSGLLVEDRVAINNGGTGPGQIAIAGPNIAYEGIIIGTYAGGIGNDLVITLNGMATTAAVEALLENLTYANVSDTPTASRTLSIQVYDDEGLGLPTGAQFTELTGANNPFASVAAAGNGSIPTFVDVDADGDLDLVVGGQDGVLSVFANDGNGAYAELTGAANPFDGFDVGASGTYSAPAAIDVDGDGDMDLVVGSNYGDLAFLENDGVGGWTNSGIISGVSVYAFSTPTAVDLDGDNLDDLVLGSLTGFFYGFLNNGDGTFTELTGANDPFLTIGVPYFSAPGFVDIDGDGDFDLVAGDYYGGLTVFTNDGGTFVEAVDQPFAGFTFSSIPAFTFTDLDGDGDLDGVAGSFDGDIRLFENVTANGAEIVVNVTAQDDAGVARPDLFTIAENGTITAGNLFADNGNGADNDPDSALAISAVNGSGGNVGTQIALASGALLTVNADGTFDYNPNGAFLTTPAPGSGASNTPGQDSFTYTLSGGNTVTVTISLTGIDSNDVLIGTPGADILAGGLGDDLYYVGNANDQVVEAAGQGNDRVLASVSYVLGANSSVERLTTTNNNGTAAINLTGNGIANTIYGNAGANILDGAGGADVLFGLGGDDFYVVDNAADIVIEAAGEGNDRVFASTSYTLRAGQSVERLTTSNNNGTAAINLTGNELANTVYGNAGNNTLDGGAGADVLAGLAGDDFYVVDNAADIVIEAAGEGNDRVFASVSYTLRAGVSVEKLTTTDNNGTAAIDLAGNELAQQIFGNNGNNILDGRGGADRLAGLLGDDWYIVDNAGDVVVELAGEGSDRVFASTSYTLAAGMSVEKLTTTNNAGTAAIDLTGNNLANTIYGNEGANVIDGKGGSDFLFGLGGADTFAFTTALGAGNLGRIVDFVGGTDKIALDDAVFTAIGGLGALNANAFHTGTSAHDADDRIIFNSATGELFYDADGNGAGSAVLFAKLDGSPTLAASDFMVI